MPDLTTADALRLAINALKDISESRKMPSGLVIDQSAADLHADAAEVLEVSLAGLHGHD
jgi:hypothetical protein